ncbi:DUF1801 domain-containing protein [Galbibacter sp. EGI 63066]|uniref:iron chaperone n=1 Tax=Galbibacter sp. EGI 63066 TaxID=2993559 RepID=UPI00224985DB|nr:DUF1801 domain-containing protein [Galbibacter sp. EGI 63066]MCX2678733.1 DUF1801 domain-containing protein [Galbibacter sp. EGI 63066]
MKDLKPKTVDEYINAAPEESRKIMQELKKIIESTIPNAEGGISWNVPIYKYNGILAGFDVAKKHVSFGIDSLKDEDRRILEEKGYKTGKKTIQIRFEQNVPAVEIKRLIMEQAKLNEV